MALIKWAQSRVGITIRLTGPQNAVEMVQQALATANISTAISANGNGYGEVKVTWDLADPQT